MYIEQGFAASDDLGERSHYPLTHRQKVVGYALGVAFEAIGVTEAFLKGDTAGGLIAGGIGLGSMAIAKWGEWSGEDSARVFDSITEDHRSESGEPL